jgi:hypothetical protein
MRKKTKSLGHAHCPPMLVHLYEGKLLEDDFYLDQFQKWSPKRDRDCGDSMLWNKNPTKPLFSLSLYRDEFLLDKYVELIHKLVNFIHE